MSKQLDKITPPAERLIIPTIESLRRREKGFSECFAESTRSVLLWLGKTIAEGSPASFGDLKEYLQSQQLPTIPELRKTPPAAWQELYQGNVHAYRVRADKPSTREEETELTRAIEERRVMSGRMPPANLEQERLPRYLLAASTARDFSYHLEGDRRVPNVPEPKPSTYRINISDAPGELREVILNRAVKRFWQNPIFRRYGFSAKIIGYTKTDGLIFYVADETVNAAIKELVQDCLQFKQGFGEPARFAQVVDPRVPGMTITTNPKDDQGKTLGTFGDVISELLASSLTESMRSQNLKPEQVVRMLLDLEYQDWIDESVEPIFNEQAEAKIGRGVNLHNLAFLDRSL